MHKASFDQNLLTDWCDYCEEKKKFDTFHFSTLLMETFLEGYTPELENFLKEITKYFDSSVYENMRYAFNDKQQSKGDILEWVTNDLSEKRKIINQVPDVSKLLATIDEKNYLIVNERQPLYDARESDNHTILYEEVGDYVSQNIKNDHRLYALEEILYNIASDYNLVHALLAGIVQGNVNLSNYLDIYRNGCDYAVDDDKIIIYVYKPTSL